jgi:RNA polymerase sigma-70 factor (ECF subfamily)
LHFPTGESKNGSVALVDQFLASAAAARDALAQVPGLAARLDELIAAGRAAWPDVTLADGDFVAHLGERLSASPDAPAALAGLHGADLFLACACARGDARALQAFEEGFLAPLTAYLKRRETPRTPAGDVKQALRADLLVANGQRPPRIASYGGQGPLAAWLQIVAARTAAQMLRGRQDAPPVDPDRALLVQSAAPDPELAYLKRRYRAEVEEAFRSTLAALAPRDRTILRLHFIEGLNAESISTAYQVSKRTAERWLASAREQILDGTRRLLAQRLQIEPSQLDTLMGLVHSEIEVNLSVILKDPDAG